MHLTTLLFIIFSPQPHVFSQFPYPSQTFELPKHPSAQIGIVHVTVVTLENYISFDITERFLMSNRHKIIPTVSTMLNRSISIASLLSFFEPCTISILIDAPISGANLVYDELRTSRYIKANEYIYRGWKHSVIILIGSSCTP
jgi:hypothetical protein